jgi:hypothetical protein
MGAFNYKLAPPLAAAIKANHSIIRDSTQRLATVRRDLNSEATL